MSRIGTPIPPVLPAALLRWLTPRSVRDQLLGDLAEGFQVRCGTMGVARARMWYWRQLFSFDVWRLRRSLAHSRDHRQDADSMRLAEFFHDLRYGTRTLARNPLLTTVVLATLALGIGANTAIFSVVNAVLLRPLPYEEPSELVMLFRTVPRLGFDRSVVSYPDFADWREQSESFSEMGAYGFSQLNFRGDEGTERWSGYRVTAGLFPLLGVRATYGRVIDRADDAPGSSPVVVLSYATWQSRFGGDPAVVGQAVSLEGELHTIVGVMAPEFEFPSRSTQFWIPLRGDPERMERDSNFLTVIGRLTPGVTLERASSEMQLLAARIDEANPGLNEGFGIFLEARHAFVVRNARTALLVFVGAVSLVLLIALANVANLMLAHGTSRQRELAVRSALGASRARLTRQVLTECTLLASVGGVLGVLVALGLVKALVMLAPSELPRLHEVGLNGSVLFFAALLAFGCGLAFGTLPALVGVRGASRPPQQSGGRGAAMGTLGRRVQHTVVVAEVALAMILVVGAGLLINSFVRLTTVELGFEPENVVAARITLPEVPMAAGLARGGMMAMLEARSSVLYDVVNRVRALPGVDRAALAYGMPFARHGFGRRARAEGGDVVESTEPSVSGNVIAGDYFGTLGVTLIRGRRFTDEDDMRAPPVLIANQAFAERFWPGEDALGKRVRLGNDEDAPWTTVVGVVPDSRTRTLADDPAPLYYRPLAQAVWPDAMFVVARSRTGPDELVGSIRAVVWSIDPNVPITETTTATDLVSNAVATPRFRTIVLASFGGVAVLLALFGIYGVISFTVGERRQEIGVRMALGADGGAVIGMVLRRGLVLTAFGIGIGLVGSLLLSRFLKSLLFDLTAMDPMTYVLSAVLMAGVAVAATYGPAKRAASIDPLESLRI